MKRMYALLFVLLLLGCGSFAAAAAEDEPHTHTFGAWYTVTEPTCTEEGEERRDCDVCDAFETNAIDAAGHQWADWVQTLAPTCTEEGEERRDCDVCDAFETRELSTLYHSFVTDPAVPVTCTAEGKTQGEHCERCHAVKTPQVTLKPLGHTVLDENGNCMLCGAHIKDFCPYCHKDHSAQLFGRLVAWFHQLFYRIRLRFQQPAS